MNPPALLKRLAKWIRLVARWLADARLFWMFVLVLASTGLLAFHTFRGELAVRLAGLTLEGLGLALAVIGVLETRTFFGLTPIRRLAITWLFRFPRWNPRPITGSANILLEGVDSAGMRGYGWFESKSTDSVEAKVEALLKNVKGLRSELVASQRAHDELTRKVDQRFEGEMQARVHAISETKEMLKGAITNGLLVSLVGLLWIFCGLVLSNFAKELLSL